MSNDATHPRARRLPPVGYAVARCVRFAWRHLRRELVVQSVLGATTALLPAAQVVLVGSLTEAVSRGDRAATLRLLLLTALAVGAASAVSDVENSAWRGLLDAIRARMSGVLARRLASLTPERVADAEWSARGQEARESIQQHGSYYLNAVIGAAEGLITAGTIVLALWATSGWAALLIMLSLAPVLVCYVAVSRMEDAMFTEQTRLSRRARYLQDQITYQRPAAELISLGSSRRVARWMSDDHEAIHRMLLRMLRRQSLIMVAGGVVSSLALAGALWFVTLGPSASLGGAAAGVVAVLSAAAVVRGMGYSVGSLMSSAGPVATFFRFLDDAGEAGIEIPAVGPVERLEARGVGYRYPGANEPALAGASVVARRGELVALVGANGAGKTTLVNLLLGALTPATGGVRVDGRDLATMTPGERLATFSLLTQEFGRFELTVREAVLLGTPREDVGDDEVWRALELARGAEFVRRLPGGLDTQLGQQWGGVGLSGGQWQRIALARIALRGAPVWLLDEPTSAVDAETEQEIFDDLARGRDDRVTVVVSHRAWTLRGMDRIYVLDEGRVVQVGTYAELIAVEGRFRDMFHQQSEEG